MTGQSKSLEKIGRYEITGELGKGAMGIVYKAIDPNIGRAVALKTMRLDIHGADSTDMLRRFQNEARAAGVLNHRNIVTIYDAGEYEGVFYIAMEYIEGTTLQGLLAKRRSLPVEELIGIGTQVCAGLDYAHKKRVVHRDIKPANIMLTFDRTVKIMDFGIAKADASLTNAGEVLGTPNYMSPEQVRGHDIDGRSDLFSTGVILYEMSTGEKPFAGTNVTNIIYKIVNEQPAAPREIDVTVHPGLSAVIMKALAKDPEDRYQTGDDLSLALRSYKLVASGSVPTSVIKSAPRPQTMAMHVPTVMTSSLARPNSTSTMRRSAAIGVQPAPAMTTRLRQPKKKSYSTLILFCVLAVILAAAAGLIRGRYFGRKLWAADPAQATAATAAIPKRAQTQAPSAPVDPIAKIAHQLQEENRKEELASGKLTSIGSDTAPAVGSLHITSTPRGAQVEIDGRSQSWYITPFSTPELKSGDHTLVVHLDGFATQTRNVVVAGGNKTAVDFQLGTLGATYNVSTTPAGAAVLIDGIDTGKHTPAQIAVEPGQHKLALTLDGYARFVLATDAGPGQTLNISQQLKPQGLPNTAANSPISQDGADQNLTGWGRMRRFFGGGENSAIPAGKGAVVVRTRPKGATVVVEGFTVPRPTPSRFPIKPGTYKITIQKDGFQPVTRVVQVTEGQISEVDEILLPRQQ